MTRTPSSTQHPNVECKSPSDIPSPLDLLLAELVPAEAVAQVVINHGSSWRWGTTCSTNNSGSCMNMLTMRLTHELERAEEMPHAYGVLV